MSRRSIRAGFLVLLAAILAACSRGIPAPVEFRAAPSSGQQARQATPLGTTSPAATTSTRSERLSPPVPLEKVTSAPVAAAPSGQIPPGTYTVQAGDGLFAISQRSGVALRELIDANELFPPYGLQAGQTLIIPAVRYHVVRPGDTVTGISSTYGVSMRALAMANDMEAPYVIRSGERLKLPAPMQTVAGEAGQADTPGEPAVRTEKPLRSASLPGATPVPSSRPLGKGAVPPLPNRKPGSQAIGAEPAPAVIPRPPRRAGSRFAWPVRGTVISGFGPKSGGFYNDGINIAVASGTPVKAAENGVVTYVGNELRGFGNLVLVRHEGGWVTAYAHADRISVKPGDIVRRGQTIARAGRSGRVSRPQLHFEIRKGRQAVNPIRHLPVLRSSANVAKTSAIQIGAQSSVLPSLPARS